MSLDFGAAGQGAGAGGSIGGPWGAAAGGALGLLGGMGGNKSGAQAGPSGQGARQEAKSQSGNIDGLSFGNEFSVRGGGGARSASAGTDFGGALSSVMIGGVLLIVLLKVL
jgi:hypothetical protein